MRRRVGRSSCVLAAVVLAATIASAQGQQRWYDAYDLGIKAVQSRDWKTAETYLLQARDTGPKEQGRRVYFYGDTYRPFYPDYYLAQVYLNTNRAREAETTFASVAKRNLIDAKDPNYAQLQPGLRRATFDRAIGDAQQALTANNLDEAEKRVMEAKATNVDTKRVDTMVAEIQQARNTRPIDPKPVTPPPVQTPVTVDAGNNAPVQQSPVQQPAVAANNTPAQVSRQPIVPPSTPSKTPPQARPGVGAVAGPAAALSSSLTDTFRTGFLAFFAGDYETARRELGRAVGMPGGNSRVLLYLAFSQAGLVLTGRGDLTMLRVARDDYRGAGGAAAVLPQDRPYISPKILELLEEPRQGSASRTP
jgi:TolA-binding protein